MNPTVVGTKLRFETEWGPFSLVINGEMVTGQMRTVRSEVIRSVTAGLPVEKWPTLGRQSFIIMAVEMTSDAENVSLSVVEAGETGECFALSYYSPSLGMASLTLIPRALELANKNAEGVVRYQILGIKAYRAGRNEFMIF